MVGTPQQCSSHHTSLTCRLSPSGPIPLPTLIFPKWSHRVTKMVCRAGCGRLLAPAQMATTPTALYAPDFTTRSRGTLPGKRLLTVELLQVRPSINLRARNHGRTSWGRIRSSRQERTRSCPPLARRLASASPRQPRWSGSRWHLQARQSASKTQNIIIGSSYKCQNHIDGPARTRIHTHTQHTHA